MRTKFWIAIAITTLSILPTTYHAYAESKKCGENIITLWAAGDSEAKKLYEESKSKFNDRWLSWLKCMAEGGDTESQLKLGIVFRDGSDGPPQDFNTAAIWFKKAANAGNAFAQFNLAKLYMNGYGVQKNYVIAHMWFNITISTLNFQDKNYETRSLAYKYREYVSSKMSTQQISEAQKLAKEHWDKLTNTNN